MKMTLDDIQRIYKGHTPQPIGRHRFFSVLVPLVLRNGELHLLFEVRSKSLKADPGEICFPGGHVEPGEHPRDCAVRETVEELGIPEEAITVIGDGDILYGYGNYTMYSYIGVISYEDVLKAAPSPEEVEEIFLVPLERFREVKPLVYSQTVTPAIQEDFPFAMLGIDREYKWRVGKWTIPIFDIDGRMIWGLTARITGSVLGTIWGENPVESMV